MRYVSRATTLVLVLGTAGSAAAQVSIPLTVQGNQAYGSVALPGDIAADLTITFESVTGLSPSALSASAQLVDPDDPAVRSRLPGMMSVPDAFPVLVRISPANNSGLSFRGLVYVELHTGNLHLDPSEPKAILKAPDMAFFDDVTRREESGSYRVCGSGGSLSEFLIVRDGRGVEVLKLLDISTVIIDKFTRLQTALVQHAGSMPLLVYLTLQARLTEARSLFDGGNLLGAITKVAAFESYARAHSGSDIPDVWRAADPTLVNVAGRLRAAAQTLQFSLARGAGL